MKILQFAYSFNPGGAERFVIDLSNELGKYHETVIFALRDDTIDNQGFYVSEISDEVTYKNLKIKPGFKPGLIWAFYKILKNEKPDIVHCHLNLVNYFFILSFIFRNKISFVYTIHNEAQKEVKSKIEKRIRHFFFKHGYFVPVAISEETKKSYHTFYNLNNELLIYNGRKFNNKSNNYKEVSDEINSFKPTNSTLTFCHVSRYNKTQKNQEMLISVFNKLKKEGIDLILLIIGDGFEEQASLKNLADDHIHFLGVKSNVSDYLYASDAFCLSSVYEGMPISLIEAFASGCVPICTPVGGCIDTIKHGVTGFLSKSIDEDDYLQAIKQFIKSNNVIDKEKLTKYFHDNFDIKKCAKNYMNLYQNLVLNKEIAK
jgi:glycosyltransferase involved in cell wall biosynthesis